MIEEKGRDGMGRKRKTKQIEERVGRGCFGIPSVCLTRLAFIQVGHYQSDLGVLIRNSRSTGSGQCCLKGHIKLYIPFDKLELFSLVRFNKNDIAT